MLHRFGHRTCTKSITRRSTSAYIPPLFPDVFRRPACMHLALRLASNMGILEARPTKEAALAAGLTACPSGPGNFTEEPLRSDCIAHSLQLSLLLISFLLAMCWYSVTSKSQLVHLTTALTTIVMHLSATPCCRHWCGG